MSIVNSYLDALLAGDLGLNKGNKQMSKIDTFSVEFKGKKYGFFTSKAGADAYLEVLKDEEGRLINGCEAETLPEVYGVLQSGSCKSSSESRESEHSGVLHCERVSDNPDSGSAPDSYSI